MDIIECPHCYSRVILSADGRCPSCDRHPASANADPTKTKITIAENTPLPPLCFGCGCSTEASVTLSRASYSRVARVFRFVLLVLVSPILLIGGILGFVVFRSLTQDIPRRTLKLKIPCCQSCRARRPPREEWIDFAEGTLSFVVHKTVAAHIPQVHR